MTYAEINESLRARGIHLDPSAESFMDGNRVLDWDEVLQLLPNATEDEISAWAEEQAAQMRQVAKRSDQ